MMDKDTFILKYSEFLKKMKIDQMSEDKKNYQLGEELGWNYLQCTKNLNNPQNYLQIASEIYEELSTKKGMKNLVDYIIKREIEYEEEIIQDDTLKTLGVNSLETYEIKCELDYIMQIELPEEVILKKENESEDGTLKIKTLSERIREQFTK